MSELGEQLKHARMAKDLSLDEVQAVTKIQKRYLQAIENGEFEKLPGSFYTKAFVKNYAEAVGLDFEDLMENYEHELPKPVQPSESLPPRSTRTTITSPTRNKLMAIVPGLFVFLIVIGILAIIWMLNINSDENSALDDSTSDDSPVEVEQNKNAISDEDNKVEPIKEEDDENKLDDQPETEEPHDEPENSSEGTLEKISASGDTTNYLLSETDKFEVNFTFTGNSWLKIQGESGKMYVNEGYSDGQEATFDFQNEPSVRIRIGSAPHITMSVNGSELQLESQPVAQTVRIEFNKRTSE